MHVTISIFQHIRVSGFPAKPQFLVLLGGFLFCLPSAVCIETKLHESLVYLHINQKGLYNVGNSNQHTPMLIINHLFFTKYAVYIEVTAMMIYVTVEIFYSKQRAVYSESVFTFHHNIAHRQDSFTELTQHCLLLRFTTN